MNKSLRKGILFGISLLLVSLFLPPLMFSAQDTEKKKGIISREEEEIKVQLADHTSLQPMSLKEKIELADCDTVQTVRILEDTENQDEQTTETALEQVVMIIKSITQKETSWPLDWKHCFVVQTYPVLLIDRQDFTRQYKVREILLRVGYDTIGCWMDEETGKVTSIWGIWGADFNHLICGEQLWDYYMETNGTKDN